MGTKKRAAAVSLADFQPDPQNPRRISDRARAKLRASLAEFGDLACIVWNRRTGELVCGHQRVAQIRAQWPAATLVIAGEGDVGAIVVDEARMFAVRIVDWSVARQRAANVTANNRKLQGEFTADVASFLIDVHAELDEELPAIAERVRMVELMTPGGLDAEDQPVKTLFQVVVYCDGEEQQAQVRNELDDRGFRACAVAG